MSTDKIAHETFAEQIRSRQIRVKINRPMARKFFTRIPFGLIRQETGESLYVEKSLIWLAWLISPVILAAAIAVGFITFHAWGFLLAAACILVYGVYSSASMRDDAGLLLITLMLTVAMVSHFFNTNAHFQWTRFAVLFLLSLWSVRFTYSASAYLLRLFVMRNKKAYAYLRKYLDIQESEPG